MGLVRHRAQDDQEAYASQAAGHQDRVAQENARPHRENRRLDETDAERASELLRSLGQPPEPVVVLQQGEVALARVAQAAQPKGTPQLGEVHPARRPLLSANQDATPFAMSPLRRQNPREEPGALAAHAGIGAGGEEQSSSLPRQWSVYCSSRDNIDFCGGRRASIRKTDGRSPFKCHRESQSNPATFAWAARGANNPPYLASVLQEDRKIAKMPF